MAESKSGTDTAAELLARAYALWATLSDHERIDLLAVEVPAATPQLPDGNENELRRAFGDLQVEGLVRGNLRSCVITLAGCQRAENDGLVDPGLRKHVEGERQSVLAAIGQYEGPHHWHQFLKGRGTTETAFARHYAYLVEMGWVDRIAENMFQITRRGRLKLSPPLWNSVPTLRASVEQLQKLDEMAQLKRSAAQKLTGIPKARLTRMAKDNPALLEKGTGGEQSVWVGALKEELRKRLAKKLGQPLDEL